MTQTTSERIEAMLGVHYDWTGRVIEAGVDTAARKIAAEIDALTRERDEARAELLKEREAYSKRAAEQTVSGASKLMIAELAEARAEVERLRPAAEAWEARQAWYARGLDDENLRRLFVAMTDADSRAIAAKEAQP